MRCAQKAVPSPPDPQPRGLLRRNLSYAVRAAGAGGQATNCGSSSSLLVEFGDLDLECSGDAVKQVTFVAVLCETASTGQDFRPLCAAALTLDASPRAASGRGPTEPLARSVLLPLPARPMTRPALLLLASDALPDLGTLVPRGRRLRADLRTPAGPKLLGILEDPSRVWAATQSLDQLVPTTNSGGAAAAATVSTAGDARDGAAAATAATLRLRRGQLRRSVLAAQRPGQTLTVKLLHLDWEPEAVSAVDPDSEMVPERGRARGGEGAAAGAEDGAAGAGPGTRSRSGSRSRSQEPQRHSAGGKASSGAPTQRVDGVGGAMERPLCESSQLLSLAVPLSLGVRPAAQKPAGGDAPAGGPDAADSQEVVEFRFVYGDATLVAAMAAADAAAAAAAAPPAAGAPETAAGAAASALAGGAGAGPTPAGSAGPAVWMHQRIQSRLLQRVRAEARRQAASGAGTAGEQAPLDGEGEEGADRPTEQYFAEEIRPGRGGSFRCPMCGVACRGVQGFRAHLPSSHGIYAYVFYDAAQLPAGDAGRPGPEPDAMEVDCESQGQGGGGSAGGERRQPSSAHRRIIEAWVYVRRSKMEGPAFIDGERVRDAAAAVGAAAGRCDRTPPGPPRASGRVTGRKQRRQQAAERRKQGTVEADAAAEGPAKRRASGAAGGAMAGSPATAAAGAAAAAAGGMVEVPVAQLIRTVSRAARGPSGIGLISPELDASRLTSCLEFVREEGPALRADPALRSALAVHLLLLREYNLVDPRVMVRCLQVADGTIISSAAEDKAFLASRAAAVASARAAAADTAAATAGGPYDDDRGPMGPDGGGGAADGSSGDGDADGDADADGDGGTAGGSEEEYPGVSEDGDANGSRGGGGGAGHEPLGQPQAAATGAQPGGGMSQGGGSHGAARRGASQGGSLQQKTAAAAAAAATEAAAEALEAAHLADGEAEVSQEMQQQQQGQGQHPEGDASRVESAARAQARSGPAHSWKKNKFPAALPPRPLQSRGPLAVPRLSQPRTGSSGSSGAGGGGGGKENAASGMAAGVSRG
ncbi:hypothetical protein GPECTOR_4g684 [Gonium pectorale]|uniref:C2H2-type domain-containing protein n=1 Tax=Gonium pectorale TaxID=33097 RepID=A0A150GXR4_GONPE|nr:hypothetical protein GPECTOR_4g684 [Gonium pectorale]|eukprot:KXZ54619.1 hypothetical protein GPECTOR_4g684 [Gonium pectorale]